MLFGVHEDFVSGLSIVLGRAKAEATVTGLEQYIRDQAKAGVLSAVPTIQSKITAQIKRNPYILGSIGVGALGLLVGVIALARTRRRS
jgi:hypothetical protein